MCKPDSAVSAYLYIDVGVSHDKPREYWESLKDINVVLFRGDRSESAHSSEGLPDCLKIVSHLPHLCKLFSSLFQMPGTWNATTPTGGNSLTDSASINGQYTQGDFAWILFCGAIVWLEIPGIGLSTSFPK